MFARPLSRRHAGSREIFSVQNTFKIVLANSDMPAAAALRQDELDAAVHELRHGAKRLHPSNVLAAAVASPARFCVFHKHVLPSAFMLRFVKAELPNGKVSKSDVCSCCIRLVVLYFDH